MGPRAPRTGFVSQRRVRKRPASTSRGGGRAHWGPRSQPEARRALRGQDPAVPADKPPSHSVIGPGARPLIRSLSRILRRHRVALAERLSGMLSPALEPCVARGEADAFLERLARAFHDGRVRRIRRIIAFAAARWTELGADPATVSRAMLALALPLHWETDSRRDPWAALRSLLAPLVDTVPEPLLVVDLDRRVRFSNRAAAEWFEREAAALSGVLLEDLFDEGGRSWVQRQFVTAGAVRDGFGRVRLLARPDRDLLASAVGFEATDRPTGWFVVLHSDPDRVLSDPSLAEVLQREKRQKDQFAALL